MAGDLRLLPGRQLGVEVAQRLRAPCLEPADLVGDGDGVALGLQRAQLLDLGLELGHRLFEVEIGAHCDGTISRPEYRAIASSPKLASLTEH